MSLDTEGDVAVLGWRKSLLTTPSADGVCSKLPGDGTARFIDAVLAAESLKGSPPYHSVFESVSATTLAVACAQYLKVCVGLIATAHRDLGPVSRHGEAAC